MTLLENLEAAKAAFLPEKSDRKPMTVMKKIKAAFTLTSAFATAAIPSNAAATGGLLRDKPTINAGFLTPEQVEAYNSMGGASREEMEAMAADLKAYSEKIAAKANAATTEEAKRTTSPAADGLYKGPDISSLNLPDNEANGIALNKEGDPVLVASGDLPPPPVVSGSMNYSSNGYVVERSSDDGKHKSVQYAGDYRQFKNNPEPTNSLNISPTVNYNGGDPVAGVQINYNFGAGTPERPASTQLKFNGIAVDNLSTTEIATVTIATLGTLLAIGFGVKAHLDNRAKDRAEPEKQVVNQQIVATLNAAKAAADAIADQNAAANAAPVAPVVPNVPTPVLPDVPTPVVPNVPTPVLPDVPTPVVPNVPTPV
ncbi:MAG: hypothetical protein WCJ84_06090, partial [Candidatus Peregrinibacteria bacterium]